MAEQIQYTTGLTGPDAPVEQKGAPEAPVPQEIQESPEQAEESQETEEQSPGLFDELSAEFAQKGELSEEAYAKLSEIGIPKQYVDQYINGLKATQQTETQKVLGQVGGEAEYQKMIEWASTAFSEAEIEAYNKAVGEGGASQEFALKSLQSRYSVANPVKREPRLVQGRKPVGPIGYRSTAEMVKAMSDPRYKTDPAYRSDVERKVAKSTF